MKVARFLALCLSLLLVAGSVWAAGGMAGLGAGVAPDYEGSDDTHTVPLFMINQTYDSGRYFKLMGPNLKVNALPSQHYSLGPVLNYRASRDNVDNNQVDAMDKVDGALEAGIFGGLDVNNLLLDLEVLADISNSHDGFTAQAAAGYRWRLLSSLTITPKAFLTYANSDYMETYFNVDSGNRGHSTLPDYSADAGIKDVGLNLVANYTPWERWGIMGLLSYKALLNEAADSPIVHKEGNDRQLSLGVMATYRWGK